MQTKDILNYVNHYDAYLEEAIKKIDRSPFKLDFFLELLDVKKATFYSKKKNKSFTNKEIIRMLEAIERVETVIEPKGKEYEAIQRSIEKGENDIKNGRVLNEEDFFRDISLRLQK